MLSLKWVQCWIEMKKQTTFKNLYAIFLNVYYNQQEYLIKCIKQIILLVYN